MCIPYAICIHFLILISRFTTSHACYCYNCKHMEDSYNLLNLEGTKDIACFDPIGPEAFPSTACKNKCHVVISFVIYPFKNNFRNADLFRNSQPILQKVSINRFCDEAWPNQKRDHIKHTHIDQLGIKTHKYMLYCGENHCNNHALSTILKKTLKTFLKTCAVCISKQSNSEKKPRNILESKCIQATQHDAEIYCEGFCFTVISYTYKKNHSGNAVISYFERGCLRSNSYARNTTIVSIMQKSQSTPSITNQGIAFYYDEDVQFWNFCKAKVISTCNYYRMIMADNKVDEIQSEKNIHQIRYYCLLCNDEMKKTSRKYSPCARGEMASKHFQRAICKTICFTLVIEVPEKFEIYRGCDTLRIPFTFKHQLILNKRIEYTDNLPKDKSWVYSSSPELSISYRICKGVYCNSNPWAYFNIEKDQSTFKKDKDTSKYKRLDGKPYKLIDASLNNATTLISTPINEDLADELDDYVLYVEPTYSDVYEPSTDSYLITRKKINSSGYFEAIDKKHKKVDKRHSILFICIGFIFIVVICVVMWIICEKATVYKQDVFYGKMKSFAEKSSNIADASEFESRMRFSSIGPNNGSVYQHSDFSK